MSEALGGGTLTPWARANLRGLFSQACTVLSIASMSRDSNTGKGRGGVGVGKGHHVMGMA